jgi:AraC-like DNA-binding protein
LKATSPAPNLDDLGFQLIPPGELLRPYVRSYWAFRRETSLATVREEYMHPQGGYGIVFNFGDGVTLDATPLTEPVFLDGTNTFSRKMGFVGNVDQLGVSFYPGAAYPFLAVPLAELQNETAALDALDRPMLLRLHAQLWEAKSLAERLTLLEAWLLTRLALGKARDPLIPASLAMLRQTEGFLAIPNLADHFAISQRQLERLYQTQVGMTPKYYARLLRVETARLMLKRQQSNTHLAAELGFYDQSHFIREFSAVIGLTPYRYMQRSQNRDSSGD